VEKSSQKFTASSVIFQKNAQRKQSPNMRNCAQSGHTGVEAAAAVSVTILGEISPFGRIFFRKMSPK
jgi:hypothetical protein